MRTFTNSFLGETAINESINNVDDIDSSAIQNPWDKAHELKKSTNQFIEPDFYFEYNAKDLKESAANSVDNIDEGAANYCLVDNDYEANWDEHPKNDLGQAIKKIWHLEDGFSEIRKARNAIPTPSQTIRIAHFDTGYDAAHAAINAIKIRHDLERNFVDGEPPLSAIDTNSTGLLKMPGHGTGTLSILAGNKINLPQYNNFNEPIGIVNNIEIVPIRIAKSVVLVRNKSFVDALKYIISLYDEPSTRVHVVTMSMGGAATKAWASVVNEAYEKGIFIVTAAGNNFGRLSPRTLVYPARFNRVVAACGVTFDYTPYYKPFWDGPTTMQGNFGPRRYMKSAIAAFTPNVPWAKYGCGGTVSLSGAGTSSATPQVAAAAALYLQKYYTQIENLPSGWQKVETIRYAMFKSASQKITGFNNDVELYFGSGVLQAHKMLEISPAQAVLKEQAVDTLETGILGLFFQNSSDEAMAQISTDDEAILPESLLVGYDATTIEMLEVELLQLISESSELQLLLDNEEKELKDLNDADKKKFVEIINKNPNASETLKKVLNK